MPVAGNCLTTALAKVWYYWQLKVHNWLNFHSSSIRHWIFWKKTLLQVQCEIVCRLPLFHGRGTIMACKWCYAVEPLVGYSQDTLSIWHPLMQTYISKPCAVDIFPDLDFRLLPLFKNGLWLVFISFTKTLSSNDLKKIVQDFENELLSVRNKICSTIWYFYVKIIFSWFFLLWKRRNLHFIITFFKSNIWDP